MQQRRPSRWETGHREAARVEGEHVEGFEPVGGLPDHLEEPASALRVQGVYLLGDDPRQLETSRSIARYKAVRDGSIQSLVQDGVYLVHARTIRAIEAPQEASEDAETVEEGPEEAKPRSAEGEARDELEAERARRQAEEERVADLESDVADLEAELEDSGGGRGSPPTVEEASDAEFRSATGGVSRREARRRSWWRTRIWSIVGACSVLVFLALVGFVLTTLVLK